LSIELEPYLCASLMHHRLGVSYAKAFVVALYGRLYKSLCYPECNWVVASFPFFHLLEMEVKDIKTKGMVQMVWIFGEVHPSYVDINFDKIFSNPKKIAESWLELREYGIISEEFHV